MSELKKITYFKANTKHILPTLLLIRKHQDQLNNRIFLENLLAEKLLGSDSVTRKDHLIQARLKQTLVPLGLIESDKNGLYLTTIGKIVIEEIEESDYDFNILAIKQSRSEKLVQNFKDKIASLLLELDRQECKVIEALTTLQTKSTDTIKITDLMLKLIDLGIDPVQTIDQFEMSSDKLTLLKKSGISSGSRLKELLRYYNDFGLILFRKNEISLNKGKINTLPKLALKLSSDISDGDFFDALNKAYNMLIEEKKSDRLKDPYVPIIPNLQRIVCYELEIASETFKELIKRFPPTFNNRQIVLAPPRKPVKEGEFIEKTKIRYYYLAILKR